MTWVLWDIFIPLVAAFGLGTIFGLMTWRWRRGLAGVETNGDATAKDMASADVLESVDTMASADAISGKDTTIVADDVTSGVVTAARTRSDNYDELESANIVLIQERDRAFSELESLRTESELLQTRVKELENMEIQASDNGEETEQSLSSLTLNPAGEPAARTDELEGQLFELEQNLEQRTVAYNEECRAKREIELELLNSKNECEKLEAKILSITADENIDSQLQHEQSTQHSETLQSELETLEASHARLQAELEQQKRNTVSAEAKTGEREKEIEVLKASLDARQNTMVSPSISVEQHQQEIDSRDQRISVLQQKLATQSSARPDGSEPQSSQSSSDTEMPKSFEKTRSIKPMEDDTGEFSATGKAAKVVSTGKTKNTNSTKTGYVPAAWSVPDSKPSKAERDDLTNIKGIGPVLEKLLHQTGIYYFQQVADLDKKGIDELQQQIPQFPNRIRRDQWVRQAKKLHREKYGAAEAS